MANKGNNKITPELKAQDLLKKRLELLQLLREIDKAVLSSSVDLEETLSLILASCMKLINASYGTILMLEGQELIVRATTTEPAFKELGTSLKIADSISGLAVEKQQTILIPDLDIEPRYNRVLNKEGARSAIAVPLIQDGRVFGVLNFESPNLNEFSERNKELLGIMADQASIAIRYVRSRQELLILREMDRALLSSVNDNKQVLNLVLKNSLKLINSMHGQVLLLDGSELIIKATTTQPADKELGIRIDINKSVVGQAVLFQKTVIISNVNREPLYLRIMADEYMMSEIVVPFIQDGNVIGVLNLESPRLNAFSQHDKELLETLVGQAAITIKAEPLRRLNVFLCHASGDKLKVRELYNRLTSDNIKPWFDQEDLLPGQDWQLEIPQTVRDSDIVLVCLSRSSISKSGYVQKEIKYALDVADEQPEGVIFLIPVRLEECEVPNRLKKWHWVDLFHEDGYQHLLNALISRANHLHLIVPGANL